jgi:hypothetical protein
VLPDVSRWLVAQGVQLYELRGRRKSLEEWFVDVMGDGPAAGMSMPPFLTIAHLTLYDARRRKILSAAASAARCSSPSSGSSRFSSRETWSGTRQPFVQRQINLGDSALFGLYAANFLSVLLASLLPVDALSGEIDSA